MKLKLAVAIAAIALAIPALAQAPDTFTNGAGPCQGPTNINALYCYALTTDDGGSLSFYIPGGFRDFTGGTITKYTETGGIEWSATDFAGTATPTLVEGSFSITTPDSVVHAGSATEDLIARPRYYKGRRVSTAYQVTDGTVSLN